MQVPMCPSWMGLTSMTLKMQQVCGGAKSRCPRLLLLLHSHLPSIPPLVWSLSCTTQKWRLLQPAGACFLPRTTASRSSEKTALAMPCKAAAFLGLLPLLLEKERRSGREEAPAGKVGRAKGKAGGKCLSNFTAKAAYEVASVRGLRSGVCLWEACRGVATCQCQ